MAEAGDGAGAPLTATVVDQLREKAHTEELLASERQASERDEQRVERLKAGQQETALRHVGDPGSWASRRAEARRAPVRRRGGLGLAQLALVVLGASLLASLLRRR